MKDLLLSRVQFEGAAEIKSTTATVWLREGVVLPAESEGRNRRFTQQEAKVARILSEIYASYQLPPTALRDVAAVIRDKMTVPPAREGEAIQETIDRLQRESLANAIAGEGPGFLMVANCKGVWSGALFFGDYRVDERTGVRWLDVPVPSSANSLITVDIRAIFAEEGE